MHTPPIFASSLDFDFDGVKFHARPSQSPELDKGPSAASLGWNLTAQSITVSDGVDANLETGLGATPNTSEVQIHLGHGLLTFVSGSHL